MLGAAAIDMPPADHGRRAFWQAATRQPLTQSGQHTALGLITNKRAAKNMSADGPTVTN